MVYFNKKRTAWTDFFLTLFASCTFSITDTKLSLDVISVSAKIVSMMLFQGVGTKIAFLFLVSLALITRNGVPVRVVLCQFSDGSDIKCKWA